MKVPAIEHDSDGQRRSNDETQARLARVLGTMMNAGTPLLKPVCLPLAETAAEPELANLTQSKLTEISVALARQMREEARSLAFEASRRMKSGYAIPASETEGKWAEKLSDANFPGFAFSSQPIED